MAQPDAGAVDADAFEEGDASQRERDAESWRALRHAENRWRLRDASAWILFRTIPTETEAGRIARQRLLESDVHYQAGIDAFSEGADTRARQEFQRAQQIAPIDPHYYFDIGDVYVERGNRQGAITYFLRYVTFMNQVGESIPGPEWTKIRNVLEGEERTATPVPPEPTSPYLLFIIIGLVLFALAGGGYWVYVRQGLTLGELIDGTPDLHPRIAYAIGCLRHELLKHRLSAIGNALRALERRGGLNEEQLDYIRDGLYGGGESLSALWRIYIETFDRLAGRRLYLERRDRDFRRTRDAIRSLEQMKHRFDNPDSSLAERLETIHRQIGDFDRYLKWLSDRLSRSKVDGQLLREAVFSVQSEAKAAEIRIDEIHFGEPPPDLAIEVFRTDLLLVLKNIVRNAILALGRQSEQRRVLGLEVSLRMELTGDESVLIKVTDTSPEEFTTDDIYGRRLDRGLGLVAAAVTRYDGSIFVEPGHGDYTKAVVIRFFRALGENN